MTPAHNYIATIFWVIVISTLELEFDSDTLPPATFNLALCIAIWKSDLDCLDHISELLRDHTEKENDTLLIDGLMAKAAEIDRSSIRWSACQLGISR